MSADWIVIVVSEDSSNPPMMGKPKRYAFANMEQASLRYDELLDQGLPPGCNWMELFLEYQDSADNPPRKRHFVQRHHNIVRGQNDKVHLNDFSKIIQV